MDHQNIVIIAAHPDDIDFRSSGSAALWTREGRRVSYIVATSGEKGFNGNGKLSIEERQAIREREQRAAAQTAGVNEVYFLHHPDGELANTAELRRDIVRLLRQLKPDLVVSGDPSLDAYDSFYGYHSDHRAIAQATFDALYPAVGNENFFPELLEEGHAPFSPKEVYFSGRGANINTWVDIANTFNVKLQALACHESQIKDIKAIEPRLRDWCREMGKEKGLDCAECYRALEYPR